MIRLASALISMPGRDSRFRSRHNGMSVLGTAILSAFALGASATAARSDQPYAGSAAPKSYSTVPTHASDHFVQGKFDKTGNYVPPHYEPVSKPPFHGYFFKKKLPDDKGKNHNVPAPN